MKYKSINFISTYMKNTMNEECTNIANMICKKCDLDETHIKKNILEDLLNENNSIVNNIVNSDIRCLGLIKSGEQCARTRKPNNNFCKIHQKTLKFGIKHI